MSIASLKFSKLVTILLAFFVAFFIIITPTLNLQAQAPSIEPFNFDRTDPNAKGWFIYNVEPGTVIEDNLVIRNDHTAKTTVELKPNDAVATGDGVFTLASNKVENTGVGSWIRLEKTEFDVDGKTNLKVPFKIEVPKDAKSGEYGGGLSVSQINQPTSDGGPISAKIRVGARIYLTVKGSLEQNTELSDLSIVNPRMENFADEINKRGYISPENMVIKVKAKELGNLFSTTNGDFTITSADGKTITKKFARDLFPGATTDFYYIETQVPYSFGTNKVVLDFKNKPLINNKDGASNKNPEGRLEFSFDFAQADLDKFKEVIKKLSDQDAKDFPVATPQPTAAKPTFSIQEEPKKEEVKKEETKKEDNNNVLVYSLLGGVIVLLIALIVVVLLRKKKETSTPASTTTPSEKKDKK